MGGWVGGWVGFVWIGCGWGGRVGWVQGWVWFRLVASYEEWWCVHAVGVGGWVDGWVDVDSGWVNV